jgi:hypothetical protein
LISKSVKRRQASVDALVVFDRATAVLVLEFRANPRWLSERSGIIFVAVHPVPLQLIEADNSLTFVAPERLVLALRKVALKGRLKL